MQRAHAIFSSVSCLTLQYFSTLSHKWRDFRNQKFTEDKMCILVSTTIFSEISHSKKKRTTCDKKNVYWYSCKVPFIFVRFSRNWNFLDSFFEKKISNFMKIHPLGAEMFHADGRTDGEIRRRL